MSTWVLSDLLAFSLCVCFALTAFLMSDLLLFSPWRDCFAFGRTPVLNDLLVFSLSVFHNRFGAAMNTCVVSDLLLSRCFLLNNCFSLALSAFFFVISLALSTHPVKNDHLLSLMIRLLFCHGSVDWGRKRRLGCWPKTPHSSVFTILLSFNSSACGIIKNKMLKRRSLSIALKGCRHVQFAKT